MSYDINIKDEHFNITYNVAPMFYKHNELGIRFIYGKNGAESTEMLFNMYEYFIENQEDLEQLNPENGWGSWEHTVDTLIRMVKASIKNKNDIWHGD